MTLPGSACAACGGTGCGGSGPVIAGPCCSVVGVAADGGGAVPSRCVPGATSGWVPGGVFTGASAAGGTKSRNRVVSGSGGGAGGGTADAAVGGVTGVGTVGSGSGAGGGTADAAVGGVTGVGTVGSGSGVGGGTALSGVGIWNCCGGGMICAPVAAVSGTVVTTGDRRGDPSPGMPPASGRDRGPAVSTGAPVDDRAPGGVVAGPAVSGQSPEGRDFLGGNPGAGRAVSGQSSDDRVLVAGRVGAGRAVSGQSFDDCDDCGVVRGRLVAGFAVSGQSFEDGCVVTDRFGAGGGFAAAFARSERAAALFGSKRGGSVCLLT